MENEVNEKISLTGEGNVLAFNKPIGWSSFDLVNKFRYRACQHLGIKKLKVGHAGTLDPLATGLMILCTGRKTKCIEEIQAQEKEYIATVRFGATTPSFDRETEPDAFYPYEHITEELVGEALKTFVGTIKQTPPIYSAVKINGKRAYALAREGQEVAVKPRTISIREIELIDFSLPLVTLRISCSKGTYIRSIARDLGAALSSGGHLEALSRTRIGQYRLEDAIEVEHIDGFLELNVIRE